MTQAEIAKQAEDKWNFFQSELEKSGLLKTGTLTDLATFYADHLRRRTIREVTMELDRGTGQPRLIPHPLISNPTEFQIPKPVGLLQYLQFWFCKEDYKRIRKAEAELFELNGKMREYIKKVMPDPTREVARRMGLSIPVDMNGKPLVSVGKT